MKKNIYESPICEVEELETGETILQGSVEKTDIFDGGSWDA